MQFFLMHDYDNNSRLDGLELLKGLSDHEHNEKEGIAASPINNNNDNNNDTAVTATTTIATITPQQ